MSRPVKFTVAAGPMCMLGLICLFNKPLWWCRPSLEMGWPDLVRIWRVVFAPPTIQCLVFVTLSQCCDITTKVSHYLMHTAQNKHLRYLADVPKEVASTEVTTEVATEVSTEVSNKICTCHYYTASEVACRSHCYRHVEETFTRNNCIDIFCSSI